MEKDILVILMMAFGLFAILMFILFYIYAKKYYNFKHINEEYNLDEEVELIDILVNKKVITFDANGYQLKKDDKVYIKVDGNEYDGVVQKDNYKKMISAIKETPKLLVLIDKKEILTIEEAKLQEKDKEKTKEFKTELLNIDEMDFIPKKKK